MTKNMSAQTISNICSKSVEKSAVKEDCFEIWNKELIAYRGDAVEIEIPEGVERIGYYVFKDNKTLQQIVIPEGVTVIKYEAFRGCKKLREIVLPASLTEIEDGAFRDCTVLQNVTIPDAVVKVGAQAFRDCKSLASVKLSKSLKEIEWELFRGCEHLEWIEIPEGVSVIYTDAFRDCKRMKSAALPQSLELISQGAFMGCSALADMKVPEGVNRIRWNAFADTPWAAAQGDVLVVNSLCIGCGKSLQTVAIPDGVTEIIDHAFSGHAMIEQAFVPASVTRIGEKVFSGCVRLNQLTVDQKNPVYRSEGNCIIKGKELTHGCCTSNIPENVESLAAYAFSNCTELRSIDIPASVKQIDIRCFDNCINLAEVRIANDQVQMRIDDKACAAFEGCESLKLLQIPGMSISDAGARLKPAMLRAFLSDESVYGEERKAQYVKYMNTQKKRLLTEAAKNGEMLLFVGVDHYDIKIPPELCDALIECASAQQNTELLVWLMDYKNRTVDPTREGKRKMKQNMQEMESPYLAKFLKAEWKWKTLPDGTMEITAYKGNAKEISVPPMIGKKPVTSIGECAFRQLWELTDVVIPEGVRIIEKMAFDSCIRLKNIALPKSLEIIGDGAFAGCEKLKEIELPDGIQSIDRYAFQACKSLKKLIIPAGVKKFGKNVFSGCSKLEELELPTGLESVFMGDFLGCKKLKQITIPEGIEDPDHVFESVLKNVEVVYIGSHE